MFCTLFKSPSGVPIVIGIGAVVKNLLPKLLASPGWGLLVSHFNRFPILQINLAGYNN